MMFVPALRFAAILIVPFLGGCAVTKDVKEMERIQNEDGFYSKSLYYRGSSKQFHYFEQVVGLNFDSTCLSLIPFLDTDGAEQYRVPYDQLRVPKKIFFRYGSSKIPKEERSLKVRIHHKPDFHLQPRGDETNRIAARRTEKKRQASSLNAE